MQLAKFGIIMVSCCLGSCNHLHVVL